MRITRSLVVVATLVVGVLLLVSGAQPWVTLRMSSAESSARELVVLGGTLAPAFVGLSLAYVAALMVALISRPVVRIVCGLIAAAVSVAAGTVTLVTVSDPVAAARVSIGRITGISDTVHQRDLITQISLQPWAFTALIALFVALIVAITVLFAGRTWTSNASRYERRNASQARRRPTVSESSGDPHETWDDLSGGDDPTQRSKH